MAGFVLLKALYIYVSLTYSYFSSGGKFLAATFAAIARSSFDFITFSNAISQK